ncbi:MAG: Hsp20/alpha crystallin family protein [bacterium]
MNKKVINLIFIATIISNINAKTSFCYDCDDWTKQSSNFMEDFFNNLRETKKNIDNIFDKFVTDDDESNIKQVNIFETKSGKEWGLEFKIPGFKKEEISIKIDDKGYLQVNAQTKQEDKITKEDKNKTYIYKSQSLTAKQFSQSIKLPENIEYKDSSKIQLKYDEKTGILEIKFPKKEILKEKPKEIELQLK